jgi:hypothetical protein
VATRRYAPRIQRSQRIDPAYPRTGAMPFADRKGVGVRVVKLLYVWERHLAFWRFAEDVRRRFLVSQIPGSVIAEA